MLNLLCCINVELQSVPHKCETAGENNALIQKTWWLMLHFLCCINVKLKNELHKCDYMNVKLQYTLHESETEICAA